MESGVFFLFLLPQTKGKGKARKYQKQLADPLPRQFIISTPSTYCRVINRTKRRHLLLFSFAGDLPPYLFEGGYSGGGANKVVVRGWWGGVVDGDLSVD